MVTRKSRSSKRASDRSPKISQRALKRGNALKVVSSKTAFKGNVFSVTSDEVLEPNGVRARRDVVRHSGSIVVLAIDDTPPERRVLLERQYRYAAQDDLWEVPAGRIDQGEKPLAAAKRELLEETGYKARQWKRALFFYPSPGFLDETMTVYLAEGLTPGEAQPEEDERIDHELIPLQKAIDMVMSGEIRDAKTIASVLWYDKLLATQQG